MRLVGTLGVLVHLLIFCPTLMAAQVEPAGVGASAQLHDPSGQPIATATFRQTSDQVLINLAFVDRMVLTGTHAIQIHDSGRCDPPDFNTAGPVFNPLGKQHGLLNPDGPMAGDLPSLAIGPDGISRYNLSARLVKLSEGPAALLKAGGTSLVIFDGNDDDRTQPEGNAGARVACGVIVAGVPVAEGSAPNLGPATPGTTRLDLTALLIGGLGAVLIGAGLVIRLRHTNLNGNIQ